MCLVVLVVVVVEGQRAIKGVVTSSLPHTPASSSTLVLQHAPVPKSVGII